MGKKIVMLTGTGDSAKYMYNGIKNEYAIDHVIVEQPSGSRKKFLQRRAKRLGYWEVFGQILFQSICARSLRYFSKGRIEELIIKLNLIDTSVEQEKVIKVPSVNSPECLETLKAINPDIIIVNGTRIISKKVLNSVNATFINTHVGITPKYRGVHGGYWAIANNDMEHCGVTVHLVDPGIDTGGVLYQNTIDITSKDNFVTYTFLQYAEGINLMKKALNDALNDNLTVKQGTKESHLWYHPTIWKYLYLRLTKGVK